MSKTKKTLLNRRAKLLSGYYSIKGDGVAHIKLERVTSSKRFRDSVAKLDQADLDQASQREPA